MKVFKQTISAKGRLIIAALILVMVVGGATIAYQVHDFTENDPTFCVSCHLMQTAYDTWENSVHNTVNCHECHYATPREQNRMLIMTILQNPEAVEPRHGKIVVPWKMCFKCHWERDEHFQTAANIAKSATHAKHVFVEQIECSKCHAYIETATKEGLHEFVPDERFCLRCHEAKEVHGIGMEGLACLACHTDQTPDIKPTREKCLICHGDVKTRVKISVTLDTMDTRFFTPDPEMVEKASTIKFTENGPMMFECHTCHQPHGIKINPDQSQCFSCHRQIKKIGKHDIHVNTVGMECLTCHPPHEWKVSKEEAQEICSGCHEYRDPDGFLG
jgi:predicted CXXCH cytochrome family protein